MNSAIDESIDDVLQRVRGEYFEMPGLQLTSAQAGRLWGVDPTTCLRLLRALVDSRFLTRMPDGRYRRTES